MIFVGTYGTYNTDYAHVIYKCFLITQLLHINCSAADPNVNIHVHRHLTRALHLPPRPAPSLPHSTLLQEFLSMCVAAVQVYQQHTPCFQRLFIIVKNIISLTYILNSLRSLRPLRCMILVTAKNAKSAKISLNCFVFDYIFWLHSLISFINRR